MYRDELYHHGVKGQKWGVRRFQKIDGSMTAEGKRQAAIKNLRRATSYIHNEADVGRTINDAAAKARRNDPMAKYKNTTSYDKHNIAMGKIKESRAILGKEAANAIIKSQISRETVKAVAATAAVSAGITAARSVYGMGIPMKGLLFGAAATGAATSRANNSTRKYLRDKKLYD